jgi:hypothetical protein
MDTTDWAANLPGIQRLLVEPGGQLPEGSASATQAPSMDGGAMPPPTTITPAIAKPVPTPVPPPVDPVTGPKVREEGEVAMPRAATSKPSDDPDVMARARDFIRASREKKAKAITDSLC